MKKYNQITGLAIIAISLTTQMARSEDLKSPGLKKVITTLDQSSQLSDTQTVSCDKSFESSEVYQQACSKEKVGIVTKLLDQSKDSESAPESEIDAEKEKLISACLKTSSPDWPKQLQANLCSEPGKCGGSNQGVMEAGEDPFALPKAPVKFGEDILSAFGENKETIEKMIQAHCPSFNNADLVISPATFAEHLVSDYCSKADKHTTSSVSGFLSSLWSEKQLTGDMFLSAKWTDFRKYQDGAMGMFPRFRTCAERSPRCGCEILANARSASLKMGKKLAPGLGNVSTRVEKIWTTIVDKLALPEEEKKTLAQHFKKANLKIAVDPLNHEMDGSFNNESGGNRLNLSAGLLRLLEEKDFEFASESILAHELGHFLVRSIGSDPILRPRLANWLAPFSSCAKATLSSLRPPKANPALWVNSRHEELMCDYIGKIYAKGKNVSASDYQGRLTLECPAIVQRKVGPGVDLNSAFDNDRHLQPSSRIQLLADGVLNGNNSCENTITAGP